MTRRRLWIVPLLLAALGVGLGVGRSERLPVQGPPAPSAVLAEAGKRLSRSLSIEALNATAARGDRVLAVLNAFERDALGRGTLRFQVDCPAIVAIAPHPGAIPFWLDDQGFRRTEEFVTVGAGAGASWPVFEKRFPAGAIGLGVNGLDRSPLAHYAVFVRSESPGPVAVGLDRLEPTGWHVLPAREGTSAAAEVSLPIRRLPAALRGSMLLQPRHDARHAALLARGRVWKTHVPSSRGPDQVVISFGEDASRALSWTWRTGPDVPSTAFRVARADPAGEFPADPREVRVISSRSERVETPDLLNDPSIRRHRVTVSGLQPGTKYVYAIGDVSTWRSVRTAPAPDRSEPFRLLYMGDPQCGLEDWGKLLRVARGKFPDAGGLLIAGDLVDRGNERSNWDHFFLRASGVFDALPMMPCAGNHEYLDMGPKLYRAAFEGNLPRNGPAGIDPGLVYSFTYADAFVAVLDSTLAVSDPARGRVQADWLDEALGRSPATWKLVMFHHPVYASHVTRESPALRDLLVPVFDRHHVDLVLQGHDHAYLRTPPMRSGKRTTGKGEGTVYVVSVSGTKFYDQAPRDYTAVGFTNLATYQTLDFDGPRRRLTFRAWDIAGRQLDRLEIDKLDTPNAPRRPKLQVSSSPPGSARIPRE